VTAAVIDLIRLRQFAVLIAAEPANHPHGATVTDTTSCTAGGRPHPATDGRLCRDHLEELGGWLRDVETEAGYLSPMPSMATRWDSSTGGTLASHRAPAVLDVLVHTDPRSTAHGWQHIGPACERCTDLAYRHCTCPPLPFRRETHWPGCPRHGMHPSCANIIADRDEHDAHAERPLYVLGVLTELADRVRGERMLTRPAETFLDCVERIPGTRPHGPAYGLPCRHSDCQGITRIRTIPIAPTIRGERELLTRQLDWIARQDWAGAFYAQIRELREQLMQTNRDRDDRPLRGHCPRPVDDKGTECAGELWPEYVEHSSTSGAGVDDGPWRPCAVVCQRNSAHRWEKGGEVARLALILERQAREQHLEDDEHTEQTEQRDRLRADHPRRPDDGFPRAHGGRLLTLLDWQHDDEGKRA
jgi:hypothetical protein